MLGVGDHGGASGLAVPYNVGTIMKPSRLMLCGLSTVCRCAKYGLGHEILQRSDGFQPFDQRVPTLGD